MGPRELITVTTTRINVGDVELYTLDEGRGPVVMLVHGFPLDHTMWRGQVAGLSDAFRLIVPDLRGFGKSDVTAGTVTMAQMAADLAALLDALGIDRPISLVGLSMGGYVAFEFWSQFPHRLDRLVLCDTRAVADTKEIARGRLLMAQNVAFEGTKKVADTMLPKLFAAVTFDEQPELVEATRSVIENTDPAGISAAQRGMAQRAEMSDRLQEISVPTLVVCGQLDAISSPTEMRRIAQAMPCARYVEVERAGHMAPLERPDVTNRAIGRFLERSPHQGN
jgi:pimeloyl-ACP methyl ester carboxylesterase